MSGNFSIGSVGGIELRISWSLLAVFALIVWSLAEGVFPSQNPGLSDGTRVGICGVSLGGSKRGSGTAGGVRRRRGRAPARTTAGRWQRTGWEEPAGAILPGV